MWLLRIAIDMVALPYCKRLEIELQKLRSALISEVLANRAPALPLGLTQCPVRSPRVVSPLGWTMEVDRLP
jgi:hypothetical protein